MWLEIVSDVLFDEDNHACNSYGIAFDNGTLVKDITTDYYLITQLIEMFKTEKIEMCHCMDIITDFLCDKTTVIIKR